ncbi:DUF305 domain-containing protein [Streptosporangium sp. NPDC023615]|uniref:DUF305 domain-containing protein n=1 Tax=Streptosporangium sp. NPDC023615 TaxID=3154794 RepID=UPI00342027A8
MSTRRSRRRRSLAATLLVSAILTAGCSSAAVTPAPAVQAMGVAAGRGDADVRFSQEMITHHRLTIRLAALVEGRTGNPYVRDLAAALTRDERADIELMSGWLRSWGAEVPQDAGYAAHASHSAHDMPGMPSAAQISSLERRSGAAFDRLWLTVLGRHLGGGVQMSQVVIALGTHRPTARLADRLVTEQRARIAEITEKLA